MNEIICPHCNKAFKVDEAGYADILKQVRDHQFEEELNKRLQLAEKEKQNAVQLAEANLKNTLQEQITRKDAELATIKIQKEAELAAKLAELEKNAINKLQQKEAELLALKSKIDSAELEKKLSITTAVQAIEKQRDELANTLKSKEIEKQLLEKSLQEKFQAELKSKEDIIRLKDEEIEFRKDMKLKLSTKMLGETLEQHCEIEFNKLRATAFQNAYFEKDNDASSGSKGDFIFREKDEQGNEIISIMFEMKNENDQTATKKRNEDFFKELERSQREKMRICRYGFIT